jgi:hypothetical protein
MEADGAKQEAGSDSLLAWLLLLPGLVLAWPGPGTPLVLDPFPLPTATGLAGLALLPAALVLLVRGGAAGARGTLLLLGLVVLAVAGRAGVADTFEARRALLHLALALVAFLAGASLTVHGRRKLLHGVIALSLLWTAWALLRGALDGEPGYAGILGNTGVLSQAALPGAVAGAVLFAAGGGLWRFVGLAAALAFAAHAGASPVLAGSLAFAGALLAALLMRRAGDDGGGVGGERRLFGLLLVVAVASPFLFRALAPAPPEAEAAPAPALTDDLGGVPVRLELWSSLTGTLLSPTPFGFGPGQFRATYPAFLQRADGAAESRAVLCEGEHAEPEHAHHDVLQALAELGPVGGLFLLAFLLLSAKVALGTLRTGRPPGRAVAAGGLALILNGLAHAPLLTNPAAAVLGFAFLGALLRTETPNGFQRHLPRAAGLALLVGAVAGVGFVTHGAALGRYAELARDIERLASDPGDVPRETAGQRMVELLAEAKGAADDARATTADSAEALSIEARLQGTPAAWEAVLVHRPHSIEALERLGDAHVAAGDYEAAGLAWDRALEAATPTVNLLQKLARLEGEYGTGRVAEIERMRDAGCLDENWLRTLGAELVLQGRIKNGCAALAVIDERYVDPNPNEMFALEEKYLGLDKKAHSLAQRVLTQQLWGRRHIRTEPPRVAVRNFRQARLASAQYVDGGAPLLRCEHAAALLRQGKKREAAEAMAGLVYDERVWNELEKWAQETLLVEGYYLP